MKSSIFREELHKDFKFDENFGIFVHYPQQFFRSPIHKLYQKVQNDSILSVLNYKIVNMEVLRRRNKRNQQCNDKWNDDDKILEKIVSLVGCRPPHWQINSTEKKCTNQSQLKDYNLPFVSWIPHVPSLHILNDLPPPCQAILGIHYDYSETQWKRSEFDGLDVDTDFFEINLAFSSSTYKEIIHVRAYDEESLVGYVGGYIGMFLGIGLLQVPELLYAAYKKLHIARNERNISSRHTNENGTSLTNGSNHVERADENRTLKHSQSDIWVINSEINRHSLVNRLDILEAKLEQSLVENRALIQYIQTSENIDKKRLQNEILF